MDSSRRATAGGEGEPGGEPHLDCDGVALLGLDAEAIPKGSKGRVTTAAEGRLAQPKGVGRGACRHLLEEVEAQGLALESRETGNRIVQLFSLYTLNRLRVCSGRRIRRRLDHGFCPLAVDLVAFAPQLIDRAAIPGIDQPATGVRDLGTPRSSPRILGQPLTNQVILTARDPRLGEIQAPKLGMKPDLDGLYEGVIKDLPRCAAGLRRGSSTLSLSGGLHLFWIHHPPVETSSSLRRLTPMQIDNWEGRLARSPGSVRSEKLPSQGTRFTRAAPTRMQERCAISPTTVARS